MVWLVTKPWTPLVVRVLWSAPLIMKRASGLMGLVASIAARYKSPALLQNRANSDAACLQDEHNNKHVDISCVAPCCRLQMWQSQNHAKSIKVKSIATLPKTAFYGTFELPLQTCLDRYVCFSCSYQCSPHLLAQHCSIRLHHM